MRLMSEMDTEVKNDGDERRVYELGYLLVPTIAGEEVAGVAGGFKDLVHSLGGEFIGEDAPKMIDLAYSMLKVTSNVRNNFDTAYFGWVKFYMEPSKVLDMKKKLDFDANVVRFLILKTIKENTMASKRFVGRDSAYRKQAPKTEGAPEATPINKEEIDKEIEAMVAV